MLLGQLTASLGVDTRGLQVATQRMKQFERKANASLAAVRAKTKAVGASMKKVGRGMSMYLTAPMALVGGAAAKMHMGFEASMSKIVGLVGVARDQVTAWEQEIIDMAPDLAKAPKELADAMFFVTSAGLRGADAMDALNYSAQASTAGLGETKDVADLVTSAMNAWGPAMLGAKDATNVLTSAVREGKAEAATLAQSMGMVLPIASNMGVTFNDVGAAVAAMTRTGTKAQTASMQLRQILASMLKPTKQAKEQMEAMGTSASKLRGMIREDGLLAALQRLKDLTSKYGEEAMSKVFPNIRALSGVLDIMGSNAEENAKIFERMADSSGALDNALEAATETAEYKWNKALASMKTALTVIGDTITDSLIPIFEGISDKLQSVADWFQNLTDVQKGLILKIGALVAVAGPLLTILGAMVTAISALISPVGLAVAGLGALAAAIVAVGGKARRNRKETVSYAEVLEGLGQTTADLTKEMETEEATIRSLFGSLKRANQGTQVRKTLIKKINEQYGEYLPNLLTEKTTLKEIKKIEENLVAVTKAKMAEKFKQKKINDVISQQMKREEEFLKTMTSEEAPLTSWIAALEDYMTNANTFTRDLLPKQMKEVEALAEVSTYSYDQIISVLKQLAGFREQDEKGIKKATELYEQYSSMIDDVMNKLEKKGKGGAELWAPDVGMKLNPFAGFDVAPGEEAIQQATRFSEALVDVMETGELANETINTGLADTADLQQQNVELAQRMNEIYKEGTNLWNILAEQITSVEALTQLFASAVNHVTNAFTDLFTKAKGGFKSFVTSILEGIQQIINALLAQAIAGMIAGEAKKGIWGLATAAIGLGLLTALWKSKVPEFAEGGAVFEPTMAMVGEGSNVSRSNPEYIGTADQLGLGGAGTNITVNLKGAEIEGDKLVWLVDEIKRKQGNTS